jgi:hypothetical protein
MTSALDIANRALSSIGARSGAAGTVSALASFNEQSNEAFQVNLLFAATQNDLLRAAHWNFARKTATLSLLKSAPGTPENPTTTATVWSNAFPPPPWLYEYSYPADCLKMRMICREVRYSGGGVGFGYPVLSGFGGDGGRYQKFAVANDVDLQGNPVTVVLADANHAIATYTALIKDPDLWDSNFQQCMVAALASRLAMPLTGDKQLKSEALQEAQMYVMNARVSDGNEGTTTVDHVPDWIAARGIRGDWIAGGGFVAGWDSVAWLGI